MFSFRPRFMRPGLFLLSASAVGASVTKPSERVSIDVSTPTVLLTTAVPTSHGHWDTKQRLLALDDTPLPPLMISLLLGTALARLRAPNGQWPSPVSAFAASTIIILGRWSGCCKLPWSPKQLVPDECSLFSPSVAALALLSSTLLVEACVPTMIALWQRAVAAARPLADGPVGRAVRAARRALLPRSALEENDCDVIKTVSEQATVLVVAALGAAHPLHQAAVGATVFAATLAPPTKSRARPAVAVLATGTAESQIEAVVQQALPEAFRESNVTSACVTAARAFPPYAKLASLWNSACTRLQERRRVLAPFACATFAVGWYEGHLQPADAPRIFAWLLPITWVRHGPLRRLIRVTRVGYRAAVHESAKRHVRRAARLLVQGARSAVGAAHSSPP